MPPIDSIPILSTPMAVTTYGELSRALRVSACEPEPYAVDFSNTHIVAMRRHDPDFFNLTACIDVFCPDGMPLVWAMNGKGARLRDRVYGPTFTREFLASAPAGSTHYLVGGLDDCGAKFRERMLLLNPALNFVGGYHGNCSMAGLLGDDESVLNDIQSSRPDFIWVGLGTPKQYAWISRVKPILHHGIFLAVGFAFDVNAGTKPDAPMWMQKRGLTWLHRLASEPRRLGTRYAKWNTLFLWYIFWESLQKHTKQ